MTRDIYLTEDLKTEWNEVGDIRDVRDVRQIEQAISTDIIEEVGLKIGSFTDTNIEEKRGDIEQTVRQNEFTEPPIEVVVKNIDYVERTIEIEVGTNRVSLPFTLS